MSYWKERQKEYEKYQDDVVFEVWRRGGNVDCIDEDRVDNRWADDVSAENAAREEIRRQQKFGGGDGA